MAVCTRTTWLLIWLGFVNTAFNNTAISQIAPNRVLILAPREYQRQLTLAQTAIDNGEYADAIEVLNVVLQGDKEASDDGEDFFIGTANSALLDDSIHGKAERLLLNMPVKALEIYELQFGVEARELLNRAIANRDLQLLSEVRRRFFATEAGLTSTLLLGKHYMDAGRPLAAARCFSKANLDRIKSAALRQEVLLLRAASFFFAGHKENAKAAAEQLAKEFPEATFKIGGQTHPVLGTPTDDDFAAWMKELFGNLDFDLKKKPADWLLFCGDAQRNAESNGSFPLLKLRWRLPIADDPADADAIREAMRNRREARQTLIPTLQPIVVDGNIYIRGARQMVAVSLKTGKRVWAFPWAEIQQEDEFGNNTNSVNSKSTRTNKMQKRIWEDSIHTQLSSDGHAVFLIDRLQSPNSMIDFDRIPRQFWNAIPIENQYNALVALEISTEGKYLWRVGNEDGEDEPALAGAFFLGAPLIIGDELYVLAEQNGDITLFALQRKTGKVSWSQQLAHLDRRSGNQQHLKTVGAVPSYSDGILVCPTSAGAIVAVDTDSRSLLWGYQYQSSRSGVRNRRSFLQDPFAPSTPNRRWLDSSIVISRGSVIASPPDKDVLMNLDLLTGKPKWKATVRRQADLYVACVHEGVITLVGSQSVRGIKLDTGEQTWKLSVTGSESSQHRETAGRGFRTGDSYFLPTTHSVLKIDLVNGKLLGSVPSDEGLHNLVAYQDQIISLGPEWLTSFYQIEKLSDVVEERLQQNPRDRWALEQKGLLLVNSGDMEHGRDLIRRALESYPQDDPNRHSARQNLVDVMLDSLKHDFQKNQSLIPELETLIDRRKDRNRLWLALGRGYLKTERPSLAFQAYVRLAFSKGTTRIGPDPEQLEEISSVHSVRPDRSIHAGIHQALVRADESERTSMSHWLNQIVDEKLQSDDIPEMIKCIRFLGTLDEVDKIRLAVAEHYFGIENYLKAEQFLIDALDSLDPKTAASSHILLGRIYAHAGYSRAAANGYQMALENWPAANIHGDQSVRSVIDVLVKPKSIRQFFAGDGRWNYGAVRVDKSMSTSQRRTIQDQHFQNANFRKMEMSNQLRSVSPDLNVYLDRSAIVATDDFGVEHFRANSQIQTYGSQSLTVAAKKYGGLLVLNYGELISVFNVLDKTPLNRQQLWPNNQSMIFRQPRRASKFSSRTTKWGQKITSMTGGKISSLGPFSSNGFVYIESGKLICVDPQTGKPYWTRSDIKPGSKVWGDEQFVMVVESGGFEAKVFDFVDGRDLGTRALPTSERIWKRVDRKILAVRDERVEERMVWAVALIDPWTNSDIWVRRFQKNFKGFADDRGSIAVVEPDGMTYILDLDSGESSVEGKIELPPEKLQQIRLDASANQFLLTCVLNQTKIGGETFEDGFIHAFDRKTGRPQWQRPLEIRGQAMHAGQPTELPVMVFHRKTGQGRSLRTIDLACIDKRDGRVLLKKKQQIQRPGLNLRGDLSSNHVELRLPDNAIYGFRFTSQPTPPSPVARIAPPDKKSSGVLKTLFDSFNGNTKDPK